MLQVSERENRAEGELYGRSFAVTLTWPNLKNAEYEVVARIAAAATNLGAVIYVVDNDGYPIWSNHRTVSPSNARIGADDCEFVVSLHFESPRLTDIYSYIALWNPAEFLSVFGYAHSRQQLASHNDVLSCGSAAADAHALNAFAGLNRSLRMPLPELFISLPEPFLEPRIDHHARLFYIGMNWERITGEEGRHHGLLKGLDAEDAIDIFGPEEFQGIKPWEGFQNYRGSLPFDGRSILEEINRAGVCLAFSSPAHQKSGVMTSRLFEGLAAGAAIIANPHPFIAENFADCVYVVDDGLGPSEVSRRVRGILRDVRRDPTEALARARMGQQRLRERFSLECCLKALFASHPERKAATRQVVARTGTDDVVHVVLSYVGRDIRPLDDMFANLNAQTGVVFDVTLVCDDKLYLAYEKEIRAWGTTARHFKVSRERYYSTGGFGATFRREKGTGSAVAKALRGSEAPFFCLMHPQERWFSDHLSSLVQALNADPRSTFGCTGKIVETPIEGQKPRRNLLDLTFTQFSLVLQGAGLADAGRFLYRAAVLEEMPSYLLPCLDGLEFRALALWALVSGRLAQTNFATFVSVENPPGVRGELFVSETEQIEFIRDSVQGRAEWLALRPEFYTMPAAPTPTPWTANSVPPQLQLGRVYQTKKGGDGVDLLRSGFSTPETSFTWISGKQGTLEFYLPGSLAVEATELLLMVGGRKSQTTDADQRCTVTINDRVAFEDVRVGEALTPLRIPIQELLDVKGNIPAASVRLELRLQHADQVRDLDGRVVDARHLGLFVASACLMTAGAGGPLPDSGTSSPGGPVPRLALDHSYQTKEAGDGIGLLRSGFDRPESDSTRIIGAQATIEFYLPDRLATEASELVLTLADGSPRQGGSGQGCTISSNGRGVIENAEIFQGPTELRLPIDDFRDPEGRMPTGAVRVQIRTRSADQARKSDRGLLDPRHSGLRLLSVGLVTLKEGGGAPAPRLVPDRAYGCGASGAGLVFFGGGFGEPQQEASPIHDESAALAFTLPPVGAEGSFDLVLVLGRDSAATSEVCTILVNGEVAIAKVRVDGLKTISVPLFQHVDKQARSMRFDVLFRVGAGDGPNSRAGPSSSERAGPFILLHELRVVTTPRRRAAFLREHANQTR